MGGDGGVCLLVFPPNSRQVEHFAKQDLRGDVENAGEHLEG